ncbi:MAG TPA: 2Fe-2S iron-sulfur cluster-binding protein [Steroidobacteraceae bacterium]|nr:2Fe-2S iron-sulfur cluster-binding protein [Steroidobacteraceae bacterium]
MLKFHSLQIAALHPEAQDAIAVSLDVPEALRADYLGQAGQHVVLRAQLDGSETRRTYSLINTPGEWPLRIVARVHERGLMSRFLAEQLRVGDPIDVLPPNGSLTPHLSKQGEGQTYVAFAAGCGITPVLSVAKAILQGHPANQFILLYGNTSTERTMCLEELLALKDQYVQRLALHFLMSREPQEVELYNGRVDGARVREFARLLFRPEAVAGYFVCGPGDMIDQVTSALRGLGVGAERIHGEHFTTATVTTDSPESTGATAVAAEGQAPQEVPVSAPRPSTSAGARERSQPTTRADSAEVTVLMDGRRRTFTMSMNDDTVLDAAARAGLDLPFSCRAGVCSTCRTKVLSGKVQMAQNYALEDWEVEEGYILACQSRVTTPTLELDYDEK